MFRHPVIRRAVNARSQIEIKIHTEHVVEKTRKLVHASARRSRSPNPVFMEPRLTSMNLVRGPRFGPWFMPGVQLYIYVYKDKCTCSYMYLCVYLCVCICVICVCVYVGTYVCMYLSSRYDIFCYACMHASM